jgi:cysteine desulfurase/selenocysteine lyase
LKYEADPSQDGPEVDDLLDAELVDAIRKDFPILDRKMRDDQRLVYLDNAATSQRPTQVVEAMRRYQQESNANVHRGIHQLAEEATEAYEQAHADVAAFVGAEGMECVAFTKNTTEAINLVAQGWGLDNLGPDDAILVTELEHHANLVPWQQVADRTGAELRHVALTDDGRLDQASFHDQLDEDVALLAVSQVSNVLGTVNPVEAMTEAAHDVDARVLVDAAQSVPHMPVDVGEIGCDWLTFSGHKMLGPTGIGVLAGRREALEETEPLLFGGEMIRRVTKDKAEWAEMPWCFEAGTPPMTEAVGLSQAIDYVERIGREAIHEHSRELAARCQRSLEEVGCEVYGPAPEHRSALVSFNVPGIHPHDLASIIDDDGVAIRAGHHCAMPLMDHLGVAATARASFYIYNTEEDVDVLVNGIERAEEVMSVEEDGR